MPGFNNWGKVAAALKPECQRVVHETAKQWQGWAKSEAPYDTGFMQENIYVSDMEGSDYGTGGTSPPGDSYLLPEEKPPDDTSAVVGCAANYSEYVELGTRFMTAQPFFYPARELARPFFDDELGKLPGKIAGSII